MIKKRNREEKYEHVIEAEAMKLGYLGLKENQKKEVVLRFLEGNDAFVLLIVLLLIDMLTRLND